jgi:hypothetical protein
VGDHRFPWLEIKKSGDEGLNGFRYARSPIKRVLPMKLTQEISLKCSVTSKPGHANDFDLHRLRRREGAERDGCGELARSLT